MKTTTKTLRLTVLVTFESPDESDFETFRQNLLDIPQNAASHGLMSQGSEEGTVTSWEAKVDTVFVSAPESEPRTLHLLMRNGAAYQAGQWVNDGGQLFDLLNDREWAEAQHLALFHGAELVAVENCTRD